MSLSQNLKKLRLAHHLSQGEIARQLGISRPAYGFWEKGTVRPKIDNLEKLANLFQVEVSDLSQDNRADLLAIYDTLTHQRQDRVLTYTKQQQTDQDKEKATTPLLHLVHN